MSNEENTKKDNFPPIKEMPPIWVDVLIGAAVAYVAGIGSILTCEHRAKILSWASAVFSAAKSAAAALLAHLWS